MSEIKKIVLQLGELEVSLTIEQAKQLKETLSELFGKEVIKEVHHYNEGLRWYYHSPTFTWPIAGTIVGGTVTDGTYTSTNGTFYDNETFSLMVSAGE